MVAHLTSIAAGLIAAITAQGIPSVPGHELDFWVGEWVMDSSQPQDPKTKGAWQKDVCTNSVSKMFGGKVIREDFKMPGFTGGSWSTYDASSKRWKQTWVDDTGAYLLFEGGMEGKEFVLLQKNMKKGHARMRFENISSSGFDWLWEGSTDGKNWTLNWHLRYRRKA